VALGAIDANGRATDHGRRMAELPLHPRLAHMLITAMGRGAGQLACDVAALLSEKDLLAKAEVGRDPDLGLRLAVLEAFREKEAGQGADRSACRRVAQVAADLGRRLGVAPVRQAHGQAGLLLALAYPDRIGRQRPGQPGRFALSGGGEACCDPGFLLAGSEFIVAAHLDGQRRSARIHLGAGCNGEHLRELLAARIVTEALIVWDPQRRAVSAALREQLGHLVMAQKPLVKPDPDRVAEVMLEGIKGLGVECLPWTKALRTWQQRAAFVRSLDIGQQLPDVSDQALAATLAQWLLPHLRGRTGLGNLTGPDLKNALDPLLSRDQQRLLDELAPTHLTVASGSRLALDYSGPVPVLAVKIQEMFGCATTPAVARGQVPVILHLLSPARRPLQITRDLAGFWKLSYQEVKKQMKGRYPKHHWPEDPLGAQGKRKG